MECFFEQGDNHRSVYCLDIRIQHIHSVYVYSRLSAECKEVVCLYSVQGPGEWYCIVLALPVTQSLFKVCCLKEITVGKMSQ